MFTHELFVNYEFSEIPLGRDIYLVDVAYTDEYHESMLRFFDGADYEHVGYMSPVACRKINDNSLELSWYPNTNERFHEVAISLPKTEIVRTVGCWQYDEKPRIFVNSGWLETLHLRSYSVFAMVDAIGVKVALEKGDITREKLIELRVAIDELSNKYLDISFVSIADSLLIKSNWSVDHFSSGVKYNYNPEAFLHIVNELNSVYQSVLGLGTYCVITQGSNEYYNDPLLHQSESKNHISLNSLGIPFAQLMTIEDTARVAIRSKMHEPAELYLDKQYYNSLKFNHTYDKKSDLSNAYQTSMMGTPSEYYCCSIKNILSNIKVSKA